MKKIYIACDHAGFFLKKDLINNYKEKFSFSDLGTDSSDSVDYPDYAHKIGKIISKNETSNGILICGSGIGMSMVANRYPKVRAALCLNSDMAKLARQHNNANILVLGSRLISLEQAIKCFNMFFSTNFEGGRHQGRLDKFYNVKQ